MPSTNTHTVSGLNQKHTIHAIKQHIHSILSTSVFQATDALVNQGAERGGSCEAAENDVLAVCLAVAVQCPSFSSSALQRNKVCIFSHLRAPYIACVHFPSSAMELQGSGAVSSVQHKSDAQHSLFRPAVPRSLRWCGGVRRRDYLALALWEKTSLGW